MLHVRRRRNFVKSSLRRINWTFSTKVNIPFLTSKSITSKPSDSVIFLTSTHFIILSVTNPLRPWEDPEDPENNERVRKAYKSVFTFMPSLEANFDEVVKRPQGFSLLHGVYDAMAMYLQIINKTFNDDDPLLGCKVHYLMAGAKYQGKVTFCWQHFVTGWSCRDRWGVYDEL